MIDIRQMACSKPMLIPTPLLCSILFHRDLVDDIDSIAMNPKSYIDESFCVKVYTNFKSRWRAPDLKLNLTLYKGDEQIDSQGAVRPLARKTSRNIFCATPHNATYMLTVRKNALYLNLAEIYFR